MADVPPPQPSEPNPAEAHQTGQRRQKRRLMLGVAVLYAASLAAACVLVIQGRSLRNAVKESAEIGEPGLLSRFETKQRDSVGWVSIHGPIYASESGRPWDQGSEMWIHRIKQLADTKGVKAIVLDIDSPGGSVGAVQEMYSQIERVKKEKHIPFVALFGDVAASGGYYIASACDKIVAHPGTLTGSIGVILETTNLQGLFAKIGLKMDPIKSGAHKDIGSPARPMTPEERKILQGVIMDAYGQFVQAVADGRHMDVAQVKPLADGRIFSGTQALANHLVDQIGDSTDAVDLAAKLGGIRGKPEVKREGDHLSDLLDMMNSRFDGVMSARFPGWLSAALQPHAGLQYSWSAGY